MRLRAAASRIGLCLVVLLGFVLVVAFALLAILAVWGSS
jgi:hypothetical protein